MNCYGLLFPHQIFEDHPLLYRCKTLYLIEEYLFFLQYSFHKQKIAFQRAAMKAYEAYLLKRGLRVIYIDAMEKHSDIRYLISYLSGIGAEHIHYIDTTDHWLETRIRQSAERVEISITKFESPLFLNTESDLREYFRFKKSFFQTEFYKDQRLQRKILLDSRQKPSGGKWTYDTLNRQKYPKSKIPPSLPVLPSNTFYREACSYTHRHFNTNYGTLQSEFRFPVTFSESRQWLTSFFSERFREFGPYEDAMVCDEAFLHHSVISPLLNTGLLSPAYVVEQAIQYGEEHDIPLQSVEGFIRQIVGWREFIRALYMLRGSGQRTRNFWGFKRKIPASFWKGETSIEPLDLSIQNVLNYGYTHHIERLMIIGNFMLLCEFDPDEVYRWFMEMFVDAFDWVMVPNVYGMSQFADGGILASKPYICGSHYLLKMGNFPKGEWQKTWDGLFWRFMHVHRNFFLSNPRLGMLLGTFDRMPRQKREMHLRNAEEFLAMLNPSP